uniref:NB-ARC domain-containing protein n=1 Tax=Fagus sylvatica TaxID=28930 RepID=A0A2N9G2B7_FAGSY
MDRSWSSLDPLLTKNSARHGAFRSDLEKLKDTVSTIKAVLLDAEEKQASDHRLNHWLGKLRDVLHDAENVLDEFNYRVLLKEVMKKYGSTSKKVRDFFSSSNPLASRFKLAHKIKDVRKRVDDIAADKDKDDDKRKIIHLLMQQDSGRNVSVIPIIGIGGLGKTTIAKLVYRDEGVVSYFELRMWVCISEDFDVTRLIKEILKSAIGSIDENLGVDQLQIRLREFLKEKKFLLVLDDVWNEDRNKWIELEALLLGAGGCNGSKIIVKTRNDLVANIMGTTPTYKLDGLSQEECLSLFVKFAFKEGEEKQHPNLLEIGKEIVRKCIGVPLAVRTLASLLYSKVDEKEWKHVRDNEIWNLEQKEGGILPALQLSYNQLSFQLKQCFAYCSLFPKDYDFINLHLIQHWMAHGILQSPVNENQELEDVGEFYIKKLLSRSFFQDFNEIETSMMYTFKVHDLVHDLALSIAKGECSVVTKQSSVAPNVCHLTFSDNGQEVTTQLEKLSKVRTVIFQTEQPVSLVEARISRFKYLCVVDFTKSSFKEFPSSIGTLKHLRLLNLSKNRIIKLLPNSICKLHSLQTLLLDRCDNLERLLKGIRNMINLRDGWVPPLSSNIDC